MIAKTQVLLGYQRPAALLAFLYLGARLNQALATGCHIKLETFQEVFLKAQQQGYLNPAVHFHFEREDFPFPYSMDLENHFDFLDALDLVLVEDGYLFFPRGIAQVILPPGAFLNLKVQEISRLWFGALLNPRVAIIMQSIVCNLRTL